MAALSPALLLVCQTVSYKDFSFFWTSMFSFFTFFARAKGVKTIAVFFFPLRLPFTDEEAAGRFLTGVTGFSSTGSCGGRECKRERVLRHRHSSRNRCYMFKIKEISCFGLSGNIIQNSKHKQKSISFETVFSVSSEQTASCDCLPCFVFFVSPPHITTECF